MYLCSVHFQLALQMRAKDLIILFRRLRAAATILAIANTHATR